MSRYKQWLYRALGLSAVVLCFALVGGTPPAHAASMDVALTALTAPTASPNSPSTRTTALSVVNTADHSVRYRWVVHVSHLVGNEVHALDTLDIQANCADCRTVGIAIQINLVSRSARTIVSQTHSTNALHCLGGTCASMGLAVQYTLSVSNPHRTPASITRLVHRVLVTLRRIARLRPFSVSGVLAGFNQLAALFVPSAPVITLKTPPSSSQQLTGQSTPSLNTALSA